MEFFTELITCKIQEIVFCAINNKIKYHLLDLGDKITFEIHLN